MDDLELAWAAGFFEGEGCVSTGRGRDWMYLVAQISQNNYYPLERFREAIGGLGKIYGPYPRDGGNPYYRWMSRGEQSWKTMRLLDQFLSVECEKRKKLSALTDAGKISPNGGVRL